MSKHLSEILKPRIGAVSLIFPLLACQEGSETQTPERIDLSVVPVHRGFSDTLRPHQEGAGNSGSEWVHPRLRSFTTILRVGALQVPPPEVFGEIRDAALGPRSVLYVLDAQAREVRVFDLRGGHLQTVGGWGSGPGEFRHPRAIDVDESGRLFVVDGSGRISLFRPEGDSLRFSDAFRFRGELFDGCELDGELYVHGKRGDQPALIHVVSFDGSPRRSFGTSYRASNRVIAHQLARGRIACHETTRTILWAPTYVPEVRGYGPTGELRWRLLLGDFDTVKISATGSGGALLETPEGGFDVITSLISGSDLPEALLQVERLGVPEYGGDEPEEPALPTYLLSPARGRGTYLGEETPRLLAWDGERLISTRRIPFPRLTVLASAR